MRLIPLTLASALALLMAACGDTREPEVYSAAKETEAAPEGSVAAESMRNRTLPADALNQDRENPQWKVPATWIKGTPSAMRRASFTAQGLAGPADISVTSFPGEVGGLAANLNRWRGQIGLEPLGPESVDDAVIRETIHGREAVIARMDGAKESTYAAVFEDSGNSWFIKMTGPNETIQEQGPSFFAFVRSVRFPDDE